MKQLAIVILNYKVPHFLVQCLDSVEQAIKGIDAEVWVVDNHSEDHSVALVRELFPWVRLIENPENNGFAKGNNLALKQIEATYTLILNPDTVIGESTLKKCLTIGAILPRLGALGTAMYSAKGVFREESKRGLVTPFTAFCKLSGLGRIFPKSKYFNQYYLGHLSKDAFQESPILTGAILFARTEVLKEVGYLDERYFMYGEDVDLSYSILKAGYTNYYLPIPILHYKGESESAHVNNSRYLNAFYGAMEIFYEKHHQGKRLMRKLIHLAVVLKKRTDRRSRTKNISFTGTPYKIDLRQPNPLEGVPAGSAVIVDLTQQSYDRFLEVLSQSGGRGITFLLHNPQRHITIGPGGIYQEV